jgi:hypothetical protein
MAAAFAVCAGLLDAGAAAERNGQARTQPAEQPSYEDRLIDGGNLAVDSWAGDVPERNASGWPRSLRLDGIYSQTTSNGRSSSNAGFGVSGMLYTPQYGAWTVDGVFNVQASDNSGIWYGPAGQPFQSGETSSLLTVWQRDMPFDGGWRATNGLGMLNTPIMDLARLQPRWIVPTTPMVGASTEWRSLLGVHLNAGIGEPGVYTGSYVPGFQRLGGRVATVGGQWALDRQWSLGAQYVGANDVTAAFTPIYPIDTVGVPLPTFSTRSGLLSANWQDGQARRIQVNYITSGNSVTDNHQGAWVDALFVDGRYAHSFGLFYMGPELAWGNQTVGTNSRGGYYRINYASRQWLWDAYVDYSAPNDDNRLPALTYSSGSVRRQLTRDVGIGMGGSALISEIGAWSAFAYVETQYPIVINRTQASTGQGQGRNEFAVSANQTWNVPAGTRLSTTIAGGRYSSDQLSSSQFGLGLAGGGDIAPNVGIDLNLQWLQTTGEVQPTSLTGNLSLSWRFLPELALIATGYRNQTRTRGTFSPFLGVTVPSPIDLQTQLTQVNERGLYLTLRYERRAGSLIAPLGGLAGGGAGTIVGHVFLDGNEDGRFTSLEAAVPNVTVILDGRFSVRTDSNGRFEFPSVAAGRHVITALPDNIPLAWHLMDDGRREVEVPVRGTVNLEVSAQRIR